MLISTKEEEKKDMAFHFSFSRENNFSRADFCIYQKIYRSILKDMVSRDLKSGHLKMVKSLLR